jgi:hypothetical protein
MTDTQASKLRIQDGKCEQIESAETRDRGAGRVGSTQHAAW